MNKNKYEISGLDCPNCALMLEKNLKKDERIHDITIDFINKILYIEYETNAVTYEIDELEQIIAKFETGITLRTINRLAVKKQNLLMEYIWTLLRIAFSTILLILAEYVFNNEIIKVILFSVSYLLIGFLIIFKAIKGIIKGDFFSENSLMSVATIGAFIIGEYPEAVLVMLLSTIGEMLQDISIEKSRKKILATVDLRPKTANICLDGQLKNILADSLNIGDIFVVKSGESIPADGEVVKGVGSIDTSALTGESLPRDVEFGSKLFAGSILKSGLIEGRTLKPAKESEAAKIVDMLTAFGDKKAGTEKFITRFAKIYTPIVLAIALLVALIPPFFNGEWQKYLYIGLNFLVISCPCAIVVSVPLAFFTGIGLAAKHGLLVKGAIFLENLSEIKTIVFDKTGTLTKGKFAVHKKEVIGISDQQFGEYLFVAETLSNHPLAKAISEYFFVNEQLSAVENFAEIAGEGVVLSYNNKRILVGNQRLLEKNGVQCCLVETDSAIIYLAVDGVCCGYVLLADQLKKDSLKTISLLKERGIETVMLTGDRKNVAESIASAVRIDRYYSELLPEQKVQYLEEIIENNGSGKVAFMGDGINDAPSIMRADIGLAMGGIGSDVAVETADVVLMNDNPYTVILGIKIGEITKRQALINIILALIIKIIFYVVAGLGYATMWMAVLADVGVTVFLILITLVMAFKRYK